MIEDLKVGISLINQKLKLKAVSELNPQTPVTFDYVPPLGDGEGFAGLEHLLMSFAGCVSTGILFLLRRSGKSLTGYSANLRGVRNEAPLFLKKICYEAVITSDELDDETVEAALKRAEEISPVWLAIKNNVEVEVSYRIVRR